MSAEFQTSTVFFPLGRLTEDFYAIYMSRYDTDISEGVVLDGLPAVQCSRESDTSLATLFWDDTSRTTFRKASLPGNTIVPIEVKEDENLVGHTIRCGWPVAFLEDVASPPEDDEDLFDGVEIVTEELP